MKQLLVSDFYCTECGGKGIPIPRKDGRYREAGHLKKLFCINCKKETNHVEIKPLGQYTYEMFKLEFANNNFKDGERVVPCKQFFGELKQKGEF